MKRPVPILVFLGLALMACADNAPTDTGAAVDEEFCGTVMAKVDSFMATFSGQETLGDRYGGLAVAATVEDLRGMSPRAAGGVLSAQHQQFVNLMTLLEFDENFEPAPYLATSWEVSEDQTELTFHLRDDVYWHDGELTTAYDVAFTYHTVTNPESLYPNPGFFRAYLPGEQGVEVVDSFTVKFNFQPHADMLEIWRNLAILPRHLLGDVPAAESWSHPWGAVCPVGNGPFRFVSRAPGESWTFEANPAFPAALGGRPYLDRYVYLNIPDNTTLLAQLLTGAVDLYVQMLPNQALTAEEEGLTVSSFPYPSIFFIAWNSRVPELSDARVRRALTQGINRNQIIEGIQLGGAVLLNGSLPPVHWAFDSSLGDSLPYDPDQARRLLEESGWVDRDGDGIRENSDGDPLEIELIYNQNLERRRVGEIIRVHLGEIGVQIRPSMLEMGTYSDRITLERNFEGALVTFETGFRVDDRDLFHSEAVDGPFAFSGTTDPELDRFLDTLQLIPDREEAYPIWQAYELRLQQVQPYTFLYSANRRNGVGPRLRDVVTDERGDWATIRQWWIATGDRERD